jgi:hypothetical protein
MSKCIINVGGTGTGKTTYTKQTILNYLPNMNKLIYDVNKEFMEYNGSVFMPIKDFLKIANNKTNTIIVYEEATIFFKHSNQSTDITEQLVRKRHTNNLFVFNFHSLRQVPLYILDFCNYIVIRNTTDNYDNIRKKFEDYTSIYEAFKNVQDESEKNPYYFEEVKLL